VERSDSDLVRESRLGDAEAFRELFERYHRQVVALAVGMTGNMDDAMDVTQETFIRAHRNLDRFLGESSFYTWLYRIAVNVGIDFRRRQARKADAVGSEPLDDNLADVDPTTGPSDRLQQKEIASRIFQGLDELTPEHKAAIILREIEGLSYEDISKVMQCSKGTVMSRLHYARRKLQAKLKDLQ
jgi:RNA polymerase sigma-70 factor, ECF subfamily